MSNENKLSTAPAGAVELKKDGASFNTALRMAQCLASSTVVPKEYHGNVGNCMIAIEMASRINTSPMMVMQNLYIVNGRPAWSSQWIIAMINSSRRYKTELQLEFGRDKADCELPRLGGGLLRPQGLRPENHDEHGERGGLDEQKRQQVEDHARRDDPVPCSFVLRPHELP